MNFSKDFFSFKKTFLLIMFLATFIGLCVLIVIFDSGADGINTPPNGFVDYKIKHIGTGIALLSLCCISFILLMK